MKSIQKRFNSHYWQRLQEDWNLCPFLETDSSCTWTYDCKTPKEVETTEQIHSGEKTVVAMQATVLQTQAGENCEPRRAK